MTNRAMLDEALGPVIAVVRGVDPADPDAVAKLEAALPLGGEAMSRLRGLVRQGVEEGWLAERENEGIRFGRLRKAADEADLSIDVVHMDRPGPGHLHPRGEIDLCFSVSGDARFDGRSEGWTVYGPESWHVPTVTGGVMDILYFLPGGAIKFGPRPQ